MSKLFYVYVVTVVRDSRVPAVRGGRAPVAAFSSVDEAVDWAVASGDETAVVHGVPYEPEVG